jgi:hypothetical protein
MTKKIFYFGCLLVLFSGIGFQVVRADEETCDTGYEGQSGTCYANKEDYCAAVTNDSAVCGCSTGYEGASGTCYANKADYCAAVSDDSAVCGCSTGLEGASGKCYANKTEYCAAVDDKDICGSTANPNGAKPKSNGGAPGTGGFGTGASTGSGVGAGTGAGSGSLNSGGGLGAGAGIGGSSAGAGVVIPTNTGLADPAGGIKQILSNILTWMLQIIGVIAIIGFIVSGIQYMLSAGDESMIKTAKRNMMYSILGIIVALASFVIIQAIDFALRGQSF